MPWLISFHEAIMDIRFCWQNGNLEKALEEARQFIKQIGEDRVIHIYTTFTEDVGWCVNIVYTLKK